jgi:putative protease
MTELLAPAGNLEKLRHVYLYGADAAYLGVSGFSLRSKAESFDLPIEKSVDEQAPVESTAAPAATAETLRRIKGTRRLYGALNTYVHQEQLPQLEARIEALAGHPFDAFIVSDLGMLRLLRKYHPETELHLSTQANCTNAEAAKLYRDVGFRRIVPGRELSLREIEQMKRAVPDLELEVFVHGAMCLAYSGRCFLSAWMTDRSGNRGSCAHSCRWEYRPVPYDRETGAVGTALEEKKRPGEYYPVYEGEDFTAVMSSKDLNMIDHLRELVDAGVDSLKIEGRMKSTYYAAVVTRAYRKALDRTTAVGEVPQGADTYLDPGPFIRELYEVSHRDFTTGFYFGDEEIQKPAKGAYRRQHRFLGIVEAPVGSPDAGAVPGEAAEPPGTPRIDTFPIRVKNSIRVGEPIEYIGPDVPSLRDEAFALYDEDGAEVDEAHHHGSYRIRPSKPIAPGYVIRSTADREVW